MITVVLNLLTAMLSSALSAVNFTKGETLLGVLWTLVALIYGINVIINENER